MTVFGSLVSGDEIEEAVVATLQAWVPTYLRELERHFDLDPGALPAPRSYSTVSDRDPARWPEDQIPAVVVMSPGLAGDPVRRGDGSYRLAWSVAIGVVVSASSQAATRKLARRYAAAVRLIVVQHPALGGIAAGVDFTDESYDDLARDRERSLAAGAVTFTVHVDGAADDSTAPAAPDPDPDDWPAVETASVTVSPTESP